MRGMMQHMMFPPPMHHAGGLAAFLQAAGNTSAQRGVSARGIEALPEVELDESSAKGSDGEALQCTVCIDDFKAGEKAIKLPGCGHMFHRACLEPWLSQHNTCPTCRKEIADAALPQASASSMAAAAAFEEDEDDEDGWDVDSDGNDASSGSMGGLEDPLPPQLRFMMPLMGDASVTMRGAQRRRQARRGHRSRAHGRGSVDQQQRTEEEELRMAIAASMRDVEAERLASSAAASDGSTPTSTSSSSDERPLSAEAAAWVPDLRAMGEEGLRQALATHGAPTPPASATVQVMAVQLARILANDNADDDQQQQQQQQAQASSSSSSASASSASASSMASQQLAPSLAALSLRAQGRTGPSDLQKEPLPAEPAADAAGAVSVRLRLSDGSTAERRFPGTAPLRAVAAWAESISSTPFRVHTETGMPMIVLRLPAAFMGPASTRLVDGRNVAAPWRLDLRDCGFDGGRVQMRVEHVSTPVFEESAAE